MIFGMESVKNWNFQAHKLDRGQSEVGWQMQNDWNFHHTRPGNREGGVLTVKWLMFLVFNKAGRHINDQFNFKNDIIQHAIKL